jgi:hypothetical protein
METEKKIVQSVSENIHMLQPSRVPERRIRYRCGLNNSVQYPERRFLLAKNLFRLNNSRIQHGQKRYAVQFRKSEEGLAFAMKYQTIPGGRSERIMSAAFLYSIIRHRWFSFLFPVLNTECYTIDIAEKTIEKGAGN